MTTYGMLCTPKCQFPELLGQHDVGCSRFVCNYSGPGYRIFILRTPGNHQGGGRGEGRTEVVELKSAADTCGEFMERN